MNSFKSPAGIDSFSFYLTSHIDLAGLAQNPDTRETSPVRMSRDSGQFEAEARVPFTVREKFQESVQRVEEMADYNYRLGGANQIAARRWSSPRLRTVRNSS